MAQRRKASAPDLSGLLVTRPIVRSVSSAGRVYRESQRDEKRQADVLLERERLIGDARRKASRARKTLGRTPNPKQPYRAFGGARIENVRQG